MIAQGLLKCLKRSCQAFLRLEPKILIVLLLSLFLVEASHKVSPVANVEADYTKT